MSSDERLAQRAANGDRRAFEEIYKRYHQDLYRFCLAMVGNAQDAQDALQNAMVKVLRALPGEKREIRLKPWLYRIARNESVEALRKRRPAGELEPEQEQAAGGGVAETAETRERLRTLLADVEQLPERQRAALVMRELSGLDFDQIGDAFGSSPAVARQTLYEARVSLRQLEAGREMPCADVMRELSDADGRVTRRREIRAHLRGCADCRAFRESIAKRHRDLAALAPLPLAASAGLLQGVLGSAAGGSGAAGATGLAGTVGAGTGKAVATSAIAKSAATVAVVAVVGVSAADRGGVIDLPLAGDGGRAPVQSPAERRSSNQATSPAAEAGAVSPRAAAAERRSRGGSAGADAGVGPASQGDGGDAGSRPEVDTQASGGPPGSPAAQNPSGGGHGRSTSARHGHGARAPEAARHGQQTAAAHKSPHATSAPGHSEGNPGKPAGQGGSPPSKPAAAPKMQAPTPQPIAGAPSRAGSGVAKPEPDTAPRPER